MTAPSRATGCGGKVSKRERVPVNAVWAICVLSWALMLPDAQEPDRRLRGRNLDRRDRPVHRVRDADHPALPPGGELRARGLAPRATTTSGSTRSPSSGSSSSASCSCCPFAKVGIPGNDSFYLGLRQLRAADRGRRVPPLRRLVRPLGPQVVQGAGAKGRRGGARADRERVRQHGAASVPTPS